MIHLGFGYRFDGLEASEDSDANELNRAFAVLLGQKPKVSLLEIIAMFITPLKRIVCSRITLRCLWCHFF